MIQPTLFPGIYQDQVLETRPKVDPRDFRPCILCRRMLKNPESIARGIGPICIEKQTRNQKAQP